MTRPHDEACEDMGEEQYQTLMGINMKGVGLSSQAEARAMLAHGQGGSIVNIASMAGVIVNRGLMQVHYNASKAGVVHMSKSMAMEWVDHGIRVNSISPGYTATPMNTRLEMGAAVFSGLRRNPPKRNGSMCAPSRCGADLQTRRHIDRLKRAFPKNGDQKNAGFRPRLIPVGMSGSEIPTKSQDRKKRHDGSN